MIHFLKAKPGLPRSNALISLYHLALTNRENCYNIHQDYSMAPIGFRYKAVWYDDVIKWNHFPRYWPFVRGIHRYPVNFPHKGQWRRALMFSLIYAPINGWVNNGEAGDLRHRAHFDVNVMKTMWRVSTVWSEQNGRHCADNKFSWMGIIVFENKNH